MKKPLLFVLQIWEGDIQQAVKLARLLANIRGEDNPSELADALLVYRRDCPESRKIEQLLTDAFGTLHVFRSTRAEVGWSGGPNGVWCDMMQHLAIQHKSRKWSYELALTTEADTVPLVKDWEQRLITAWRAAKERNYLNLVVAGCWAPIGEHECGHINGNMLVDPMLGTMDYSLIGCRETVGWDTWFAPVFKRLGWADIPEIRNLYRETKVSSDKIDSLVDKGCVWLHGIKDESALDWARANLVVK